MPAADSLNGYIWILLAAFFWSLIGVLSKLCMSAGVSPLETAFWRAAFGGALFLIHAAARRGLFIPARDAGLFLLFGIWGVGIFFGATQYAIQRSGAAMAVVLRGPERHQPGLLFRRQSARAALPARHCLRPADRPLLCLALSFLPLVAGPLRHGHHLRLHAGWRRACALVLCARKP